MTHHTTRTVGWGLDPPHKRPRVHQPRKLRPNLGTTPVSRRHSAHSPARGTHHPRITRVGHTRRPLTPTRSRLLHHLDHRRGNTEPQLPQRQTPHRILRHVRRPHSSRVDHVHTIRRQAKRRPENTPPPPPEKQAGHNPPFNHDIKKNQHKPQKKKTSTASA